MTLVPSSSHPSSGGGGFTIGSSALVCETLRPTTVPLDNSVAIPWVQVTLHGTDLSIDGVDPSIIHFAASGWYGWGYSVPLSTWPAAATVFYVTWSIPVDSSEQAQAARQTGASLQMVDATALPFAVTAGDTLQFWPSSSPFTAGDTGVIGDGYLCVTRFA